MNINRLFFLFFIFFAKLGRKLNFLRNFILKFPPTNKVYFFIYYNLRPKKHTVITVQGSKMLVDPRHSLGASLWGTGFWEKMETIIIQEYIKKGMVVVDVGANIGYYSLLAARLVGKAGRVYAFEPAPENYATLTKNIEMNGYMNIVPVQKAVSNKNGVAQLFIDAKDPLFHRLQDSENTQNTIEVSTVTLDDFFRDKGYKVDLIKMDVEGAEMFALEGMQSILKENNNLVIFSELNPHLLELSGVRPINYLNKLVENGFKVYEIDEENKAIHNVDFTEITQVYDNHGIRRYPTILCKRE